MKTNVCNEAIKFKNMLLPNVFLNEYVFYEVLEIIRNFNKLF